MYEFPPTPQAAQWRLDVVRPMAYAQTRQSLDGDITCLSPYLTHGFLSLRDVAHTLWHQHHVSLQHRLLHEMGWREYFQHVQHHLGEGIGQSLQPGVLPDEVYAHTLPEDVRYACTRVPVIDHAIRMLYTTGYLHHHARRWLASYLVHMRKVHWRVGADWLYSHLLDGDLASNYLNWQSVAGTTDGKPYLFTAQGIEPFLPESWYSRGTALDVSAQTMEILATNPATVAQARKNEWAWDEPAVLTAPPQEWAFTAPQVEQVAGREVWLVHPWMLAELPTDLPPAVVPVAVVWSDIAARHPWDGRRWQFVAERMAALTPHRWWGTTAEVAQALGAAKQVHVVAHARLPLGCAVGDQQGQQREGAREPQVAWQIRPAPRLFRALDTHCGSFSEWWTQVNKGVRYFQQLLQAPPSRGA